MEENNKDFFKDVWFQKYIYKPQNFGKLVFIYAEEFDKDHKDPQVVQVDYGQCVTIEGEQKVFHEHTYKYYKVSRVVCEAFDGEIIHYDSFDAANFIELIDKEGNVIFIYNVNNRLLCTQKGTFHNVTMNMILDLIGDDAASFFTGKKLETYNIRKERAAFIENSLLTYNGGLYYILKHDYESVCLGGSHNDARIYNKFNKYLCYDGGHLYEIIHTDNDCLKAYEEFTPIHFCVIPDVDEKCKKFDIKLHS